MATWDDVAAIALALPATETGAFFRTQAWKVAAKPKPKAFAWIRPLNASDVRALTELGRPVPDGEILGLRTADMEDKAAVLEQFAEWVFDIPHFANFTGVLVRLDAVPPEVLEDLITDAWLAVAPCELVAAFLAEHRAPEGET